MANCNKLFLDFNQNLNVLSTKKTKLSTSKKELRRKITDHFKEHHPDYKPKFFTQGSQKLGTVIRIHDDTCDLDDGVYFLCKPDVTATTLQRWVYEAVEDHTSEPAQWRKKCIRVTYKADYHIDLPVYYMLEDEDHPHLAVKNEGWQDSDPKEFITWFRKQRDTKGQLVRLVKYLKSWCDWCAHKMPSGLCMTVLAERNFVANDRDDCALRALLKAIRTDLKREWKCTMPTTPQDDLLSKYSDELKRNFFDALDEFIDDADEAVDDEKNQLSASKLWRHHLGPRFPDGLDEDVDAKEAKLRASAVLINSGRAATTAAVGITTRGHGVPNQSHRFDGGRQFHPLARQGKDWFAVFHREKQLVERHYPAFRCQLKRNALTCRGEVSSPGGEGTYHIKIDYTPGRPPKVFVLNPDIEYRHHALTHFYPADNSLCLYYPGDLAWSDKHHLYDKTIPWLAEWLVFYELYQITGRWEGPAVDHRLHNQNTSF
ncbi:hypothetical protein EJV47_26260 [Hymenobacter gummosus]|uniref:Cyclic GMP-AMP synthase n=1 Tax=Hymenobacter gummosus TaxID=1776032 RepID=A0A3S0H222_9BACT|nr:hypothetical protein [Hymenobacter gummosus]RTQ45077.1 hypothetical protein EJV47_26260 [Hymenobacter gummosus]